MNDIRISFFPYLSIPFYFFPFLSEGKNCFQNIYFSCKIFFHSFRYRSSSHKQLDLPYPTLARLLWCLTRETVPILRNESRVSSGVSCVFHQPVIAVFKGKRAAISNARHRIDLKTGKERKNDQPSAV